LYRPTGTPAARAPASLVASARSARSGRAGRITPARSSVLAT